MDLRQLPLEGPGWGDDSLERLCSLLEVDSNMFEESSTSMHSIKKYM
jgi:hypothetical protein